jgi:SAM-dependent methyltransferase
MINLILKFPFPYRFYQKFVRSKYDEYNFIKFIFSIIRNKKNIRVLDLCCGDGYVLNFIKKYIKAYLGVDNNKYYLSLCKKKWNKFDFLDLDITDQKNVKYFKEFKPNFIFMNGAIHHLDSKTVKKINKFIINNFPKAAFLSIDPVIHNNNFINKLMIKFDRGKFIKDKIRLSKIMINFKSLIIDDFYKMSFQNIFYYRNLDLKKLYEEWSLKISLNKN